MLVLAAGAAPAFLQEHDHHPAPPGPAVSRPASPLRDVADLIRRGDTAEARRKVEAYLKLHPNDAEGWYQLARAHLTDFYGKNGGRVSLGLAMEALAAAIKANPDHVYALRAKSVIHARAELLYYDPNLAYELAARVVKLQPFANEYLLNLSEWMSGEVRFTEHSDHRVPHDPQIGLDRSIQLLEQVVSGAVPFSPEEGASLFLMAKSLARRGNYNESIEYFTQALGRAENAAQRMEVLRELGAAQYRRGDFNEAARNFYQALQVRNNLVDQWMLKTALDQLGPNAPPLPASVLFPGKLPGAGEADGFAFKDVAKELGVDRFDGNGTCSWGDIDADGDLDLFLAGSGTFMAVYRNDGGKFREITAEVGLGKVPSGYSLNVIDYDNDGRLDLYISYNGWNGPMPNRLYRNTGGRFEDVTAKSGAGDPGSGFASVWGDLDNDGWLDFAVANGVLKDGSTPQVYRNNRDGTFTNVTREAGIVEPPTYGTIGIAMGDYDGDGDLDLLMNGLNNSPNRLYRNEGKWKFTEVAKQAGVVQPPHNGFVCFFVDYNNDARPDILTTSLAPWEAVVDGLRRGYQPASKAAVHPDATRLFRNNGDGTFTDVTFEAKLFAPMGTMGAGVADLDNDGYIDFYFGTGDPQLSRLEPNRMYRNNGDGTFSDITGVLGLARPGMKGHGVSFVDIDEDGDLDLYAQLGGHYQGDHAPNAFYRNLRGNRNGWITVTLEGVKSNRYGVGATVTARAGKLVVHREVKGSEGFGATNPYRVHMGLGKEKRVDRLEVRWPSGVVQVLEGLEAGRGYTVREEVK